MRLNVFNQLNLQRACGYQVVVVSGCSGAVRLSLRRLLQWRAVTACKLCSLCFLGHEPECLVALEALATHVYSSFIHRYIFTGIIRPLLL